MYVRFITPWWRLPRGADCGLFGPAYACARDAEVPAVLREGLYAVPALLGAAVPTVAQWAGSTHPAYPVLGAAVCVAVRVLGYRYDVNVPAARAPDQTPATTTERVDT